MAERRMFSKSVIGSARFLRMPASSRLLYYDLGMQADDDGIVEAFAVMRTTGATEDDLRVLASREFIRVLNDDLVSYITDWKRNNLIKKDRYQQSAYHSLLVQIGCGTKVEPEWNQSGTQVEPQVRLGKDSKESMAPPAAPLWTRGSGVIAVIEPRVKRGKAKKKPPRCWNTESGMVEQVLTDTASTSSLSENEEDCKHEFWKKGKSSVHYAGTSRLLARRDGLL